MESARGRRPRKRTGTWPKRLSSHRMVGWQGLETDDELARRKCTCSTRRPVHSRICTPERCHCRSAHTGAHPVRLFCISKRNSTGISIARIVRELRSLQDVTINLNGHHLAAAPRLTDTANDILTTLSTPPPAH